MKLRRLVRAAYDHVPYYRRLFDQAGVSPDRIRNLDDLRLIPVTTKSDLQRVPLTDRLHSGFQPGELVRDYSSGSSGQPLEIRMDRDYWLLRNVRFQWAIRSTGYRLGSKLFLLTDMAGKRPRRWLRWHYGSVEDDPLIVLEQVRRFRPRHLYGYLTPLREMAEKILADGEPLPDLRSVITTAESLDRSTFLLFKKAFRCGVFDFYGMTETGLVAWECGEHRGYHIAEDSFVAETAPLENGSSSSRLLLTDLDLLAMPLIRYDTGDLTSGPLRDGCRCGLGFRQFSTIEGRAVDCVQLADGRRLSPYLFISRLEVIPGVRRFQLVQTGFDEIYVTARADQSVQQRVENSVRRTVGELVGPNVAVLVEFRDRIGPTNGQKFRAVERRMAPA